MLDVKEATFSLNFSSSLRIGSLYTHQVYPISVLKMPGPVLNKTTFVNFSVQSLDCSTFPCWICIKLSAARKAVTCPSNQRTVVCDGDLSAGGEDQELGSHTNTSVHIMNPPLVLITYW